MPEFTCCFISDTHNKQFDPAPADVLVHCGDLTNYGGPTELADGVLWLANQPHKHVAFLPGNHDLMMENEDFAEMIQRLVPRVKIIKPGLNVVGPLCVASLPWVQLEGWAFNAPNHVVQSGVDALIAAKGRPEVLVTHSPPRGTLDRTDAGYSRSGRWRDAENVGRRHYAGLAERLGAQVHAFGHIHECGAMREQHGSVTYVNAAMLKRDYETLTGRGMVERIRVGA